MKCTKCEDEGGFERAIIDILTEAELGCICETCLDSIFDPVFQDDIWQEDSGCAVCADEPHYHLPPVDLVIEYDDSRPTEIEYGITASTVRLCASHLKQLLDADTVEAVQAADPIPQ